MCCITHLVRDETDPDAPALLALDNPRRCQCKYGQPCLRALMGTDGLCEWCHKTNHEEACDELAHTEAAQRFGLLVKTPPGM